MPKERRDRDKPQTDPHVADGVRLQKVLAQAGFGSRRKAEDLIAAGRVSVDGEQVREPGLRVDPETSVVHVDGARVVTDVEHLTLAINKPRGVISAMSDPDGRPTIADLLGKRKQNLFHVGRLDADSEGLLLVTNDGDLAHRLAHPSYEVTKTYVATVGGGPLYPRLLKQLLAGVELADGIARADRVKVLQAGTDETLVEIVLHEGRNRIVRRMFDAIGRPVHRLVRTRIGPIALGELRPGKSRVLNQTELGALMSKVGM